MRTRACVCACACMHACMHECVSVSVLVCKNVCMHVCVCVCLNMHACVWGACVCVFGGVLFVLLGEGVVLL